MREPTRSEGEQPPLRDEDLVGATLGRFRVLSLLGRGGMGVVYCAEDDALRRRVALKVLPSALVGDGERRARFLREARAAAATTHPTIATVYDVGEDGGRVFVAMELVAGKTLRELLQGAPLPIAEVARVGAEIARGLAKAHAAGVIHRDLKPENVMVSAEGQVKILDFGLAKLDEGVGPIAVDAPTEAPFATEEGRILGTPSYMSPEQIQGGAVDERTDQFSLGVVLYELASGRRPFSGASNVEVFIAVSRDEPAPMSTLRPDVPAALEAIVARCLRKDRAARWASAAELAEALARVASGSQDERAHAVSAVAPPSTAAPKRAGRRSPRARMALGLGLALAFGAALAARGRSDLPFSGPTARSLLGAPTSTLACPVWEASGVDAPSGWLGAAASRFACSRAGWLLGGAKERTRWPAELLELPGVPSDDFPVDPYGEPEARARSLQRSAGSSALLDGSIARTREGFSAVARLVAPDGSEVSRVDGARAAMWQAVARATDRLFAESELPKASAVDPVATRWLGPQRAETGVLLEDDRAAVQTGVDAEPLCAAVDGRKDELGADRARAWGYFCTRWLGVGTVGPQPPLDRTSGSSFASSVLLYAAYVGEREAEALAREAAAFRADEPSEVGRARLLGTEGQLLLIAGQKERGRALLTAALQLRPSDGYWRSLLMGSLAGTESALGAARAYAAWDADMPSAWHAIGEALERAGGPDAAERALAMYRRALVVGSPRNAAVLVGALLDRGLRDEARAVGAGVVAGPEAHRFWGECLLARVEASDLRLGPALERLRRSFAELPSFGKPVQGHLTCLQWYLEIAEVAGQGTSAADGFVDRFVLAEPHRLWTEMREYEVVALGACLRATPERRAPCLARVRATTAVSWTGAAPGVDELLRGAEPFLDGDVKGAVATWRGAIGTRAEPALPAGVFDTAGDAAVGARLDARDVDSKLFHGAHPAAAREARRAAQRGDLARARELARRVADAWAVADITPPALSEMQAILATKP
jgi:predicted Ser/Thr protein kinase